MEFVDTPEMKRLFEGEVTVVLQSQFPAPEPRFAFNCGTVSRCRSLLENIWPRFLTRFKRPAWCVQYSVMCICESQKRALQDRIKGVPTQTAKDLGAESLPGQEIGGPPF